MRAMDEERAANRNVRPGSKMVESTPERIESDPLLSGLIEFA